MPETRLIPIYNLRLERQGSIRYAERDISTPAAASTLAREIIAEELTTYAAEQFVTVRWCLLKCAGDYTASHSHPR